MSLASGTPAAQPQLAQGLAAELIEDEVLVTQLRLAYERLPQSALMTVGVVVLFTIFLMSFFPLQLALCWAAVIIIAAGRTLSWRAHTKTPTAGQAQKNGMSGL